MPTALRSDLDGDPDPGLALADLSRELLCRLGREYLLIGHLQDRVGLPIATQCFGEQAQLALSIDEWMCASPIYSLRMQRALGFEGDDVETVFKNLQLDIGAAPQFMDFQFRLDGPGYGEFWLAHCGALLDVEPFGEERVRRMCHDIEDPTFDATAAATNPRMKVRPIHRPPRRPAGRHPHCRWSVFIDDESTPYEQHAQLPRLQATRIANVALDLQETSREPGGWADYSGPFDPGFQLEDLGHRALVAVCQEAAVQAHLLARALLHNVAVRHGEAAAAELARRQWIGAAAVGALRLRRALRIEADDLDAIAKVFLLHPHFQPRSYVDLRILRIGPADGADGPQGLRIAIGECPALEEADACSWFGSLGADAHPALDAIAGVVNPRARCVPVAPSDGARLAWDVIIDPDAEPRGEPQELQMARYSRGVDFELEQRRLLRD